MRSKYSVYTSAGKVFLRNEGNVGMDKVTIQLPRKK